MSQDSDLVHASSPSPLLVKLYCIISKEKSGNISPLFPTIWNGAYGYFELWKVWLIYIYVCVCLFPTIWNGAYGYFEL